MPSGGGGGLIQIGVIPSQANTVTYNGNPQQCDWNDYDPVKLEMDGDYEATNAGAHTVGFTPQGNCVWTDGTQDRKTAIFTIDKAAGVLTLSATSGSVTADDTTSFTMTTAGDGEITVTSDETSVATVNKNGNTIEVTGVKAGTANITVSVAEGTNYLAPASQTFAVTVAKRKITVPTVTNTSKTYTGSSQSPTVTNEPSTTYATCTGKSGTNADDYTLSYALTDTDKYEWSDDTIANKTYPWAIAKATGSLSISATSGNVDKGGTSTFTITAAGDGAITVTSGNTSVATVSKSGNTVTITGVGAGTATITVAQAAGTNHTAPANKTYSVTVMLSSTLNNVSWADISAASKAGTGDTYWNIGDCKEITLNGKIGSKLTLTNEKLCVFILDFNHAMNGTAENNIIWGGFKTALTDGVDVALVDAKYNTVVKDGTICFNMSHKTTATSGDAQYGYTYGGWKGSDLRYDILGATSTAPSQYNTDKTSACVGYDATAATLTSPKADTLLAALPSDLRSAIRLWTRWVDAVGGASNVDANIKATVDAITLLAEPEIFATRSYANEYEKNHNTRMAYYENGNGTIKKKHSDATFIVWWWESSPYYNNTRYFCYVNTNGNANGNNAYYSNALAPDFKMYRSQTVAKSEEKTFLKGETFPVAEKAQNCQLQLDFYGANSDVPARTPPQNERVHGEKSTSSHYICSEQSRLDGTQKDIGTEGEFIRMSRRKGRRFRRQSKRLKICQNRSDKLGGIEEVFNYHDLYKAGKKCCNGVRWKQSVQNFEAHLFSGTAVRRRAVVSGNYQFSKYNHFNLCERGKVRPIDAPRIHDRQVEKVYTQKVLLPLYLPSMIYNNGASLPRKGFHFSQKMLVKDISHHFRKYGKTGGIILADGKKFFPSAAHSHIYERHKRLILDDKLRAFGDSVIQTVKAGKGMPLGVEPSQAEMIAYPSEMDNYLSAQCKLTGGHYMDDFYYLLPPNRDYREVLKILSEKASFELNQDKTRYIPLTKIFRYCKTKYIVTDSGKIIRRANRTAVPRDKRKIKALHRKVIAGEKTFEDVWTSAGGMLAYLEKYDEHKNILKLRRLFYSIFGFSCESIENFRKRDK